MPAERPRVPQTMTSSPASKLAAASTLHNFPIEHKSPAQPSTQKTASFRRAPDRFWPIHGRGWGPGRFGTFGHTFGNFLTPPPGAYGVFLRIQHTANPIYM
jgi:hypothetical protein